MFKARPIAYINVQHTSTKYQHKISSLRLHLRPGPQRGVHRGVHLTQDEEKEKWSMENVDWMAV